MHFFLIETEAEDSPGIDFDENQYDLKKIYMVQLLRMGYYT